MTRLQRALTAAGLILAIAQAGAPTSSAAEPTARPGVTNSLATFGNTVIDMSTDWGVATACAITPTGNRCYRNEEAMDVAESQLTTQPAAASAMTGIAPASSCATTLRLYTGTSYTGSVVSLSTQATWINLSTYGIDNATSSYKVGACSSVFRDGVAGTGSTYPGSTVAGAQATSMVAGWDNAISSVRIN
jgi:hypothetical protein